jgi:anti-sigma factor RsiW
LNIRDYACAKVRGRLDSYIAGELSVDLSHEMLEHLERCPECRAELAARERLRAAVRRVSSSTSGPREGFEDEVRSLLARTRPRRVPPAILLLAASLAVAAGLAGWVVTRGTAPSIRGPGPGPALEMPAAAFAALTHKNCALAGTWPKETASAEAFTKSLDPALAEAARVAAARLPGYAPVSAHECVHDGEKVLHVVFRRRGSDSPDGLVSVLATRSGSAVAAAVRTPGLVGGGRRDGFSVAGERTLDGRLVLLVTSASESETESLGRAVLPAFATALSGR